MAQKNKKSAWADCCEDWGGYMAAKKAKLEEQFQETAKSEFSNASTLFSGIAIFVNGYTTPTADELKRLMMAHGGIYHHYLRSQTTTHMIASNLPYSKIVAYRKAQNPLPLCKPEWITDSIKAGQLLDFRNYLLYSQCTKSQPAIMQMIKQTKPVVETQTTTSDLNFTASSIKENVKNGIMNPEKTAELKLQVTSNPEVASVIANCTKNPEFLTEFYNNSRLHHIATMGAMFKDYINDLRDKSDGNFPGLEKLKSQLYVKNCKAGPSNRIDDSDSDDDLFSGGRSDAKPVILPFTENNRIIMHIDMDCFFVSVGLRSHPELRGFPIAVAHAKGNKQSSVNDPNEYGSMSEVASCSYEARKAGVKNGMLLGQALKLCPNLKTIRYDFDGYKEVSHMLYDTVASYTLDIEAVSCDEMYADCTKILQASGLSPLEFATVIRNEIKQKTGCPVSTGFGGNKLQARLATKKAKPDGQHYLTGDSVKTFIRTLNVRDLPGVGYSTSQKLQQKNVQTCKELEAVSLYELQKEFGKKTGQLLHDMCRGIDHNKLNLEHVRKSISAEVNYGIRFENTEAAHEFLKKLSIEISDRLKKIQSKGRCITLKVMFRAKEAPNEPKKFMGHGLCDAFNKSKNLIAATDDPVIITRETLSLWNQLNQNPEDARGIGIQMTKLESTKTSTKSSGSTLLKFIEKGKASMKTINENDQKEQHNTESLRVISPHLKVQEYLTNLCDEKSKSLDVEEIILEDQLGSEEFQIKCNNENGLQEKIVHNKLSDLNDNITSNIKNQQASSEFNCKTLNSIKKDKQVINKPVIEQTSKPSSQLTQTKQSQFFKQTKPSSANRSGKIKMPDIHEIDMKVLIELPEDIRNEILNEYKQNKGDGQTHNNNADQSSEKNLKDQNSSDSNTNMLEKDVSFSQIDPDYLAALPEEMRKEIKSYCDSRKKERNVQVEEKRPNIGNRGWNMFKNEKRPQKTTKTKIGKQKTVKGSKKETKNTTTSNKQTKKQVETTASSSKMETPENNAAKTSGEKLVQPNRSFHFDCLDGNEQHSEMLSSLVNCLLDLPISQVKKQIHEWIVNNSDVNEVDFLSMTTYLGTLPRKKRIEDLHILLKCLYRIIDCSKSCVWHETYRKMLNHVQARMRLAYGYNIMIPEDFECDKCCVNPNRDEIFLNFCTWKK